MTVTDDDGDSGSGGTNLTVANLAPEVISFTGSIDPIALGGVTSVTATFDGRRQVWTPHMCHL